MSSLALSYHFTSGICIRNVGQEMRPSVYRFFLYLIDDSEVIQSSNSLLTTKSYLHLI